MSDEKHKIQLPPGVNLGQPDPPANEPGPEDTLPPPDALLETRTYTRPCDMVSIKQHLLICGDPWPTYREYSVTLKIRARVPISTPEGKKTIEMDISHGFQLASDNVVDAFKEYDERVESEKTTAIQQATAQANAQVTAQIKQQMLNQAAQMARSSMGQPVPRGGIRH